MKKNFFNQFFRPPHMPQNIEPVDKHTSLFPPENSDR